MWSLLDVNFDFVDQKVTLWRVGPVVKHGALTGRPGRRHGPSTWTSHAPTYTCEHGPKTQNHVLRPWTRTMPLSYHIFVIFSPHIQFLVQFVNLSICAWIMTKHILRQNSVNRNKTAYIAKNEILQQNSIKDCSTSVMWINLKFLHMSQFSPQIYWWYWWQIWGIVAHYATTPLPRNLMWRKRDLGNHMGDTTPHAHDPTHTQDMTTHNKCSLPLIHQVVAPGRTGRSVVWFPSYRCAQKLCS